MLPQINSSHITTIFQAHSVKSPSILMSVRAGVHRKLRGEMTKIIDVGVPTVQLLTSDSTTESTVVSGSALSEFAQAVHELIENKKPFYTQLHKDWSHPAFEWSLVS